MVIPCEDSPISTSSPVLLKFRAHHKMFAAGIYEVVFHLITGGCGVGAAGFEVQQAICSKERRVSPTSIGISLRWRSMRPVEIGMHESRSLRIGMLWIVEQLLFTRQFYQPA